ncbi:hypothetical protein [Kitasatospora viridis]|uniref:Uncharacterized protein n=1 Tax=Kitasatospora viridis TaxID=281105 RepID=A0A561SDB7_9ACTN|nr:hypothetical protein [Kitasatospora viridis]TWF72861.1 hypothetical protein FHX73_1612 [Kitasatospora viridis]
MSDRDSHPAHHPILVVDIENSSGRPADVRLRLQRDTADLVGFVLAEAGTDPRSCTIDERGDGALVVLPSGSAKTALTDACLHQLPGRLGRLARQHTELARLRLRIALHAGELVRTAQGSWLGDAVDQTFRLADSPLVKEALAAAPEALMALVVSESWFDGVVRPGLCAAREQDFRPLSFTSHGRRFDARLALPGAAPTVQPPAGNGTLRAQPDVKAEPAPAPEAEPTPAPAPAAVAAPAHGAPDASGSVTMRAEVSGGGSVFQAAGDQTINLGGEK